MHRDDHPVGDPAAGGAVVPGFVDRLRDGVGGEAEDDQTAGDGDQLPRELEPDDEARGHQDVEEVARVRGSPEQLEQDADDDRAEDDAGLAALAAEDDHRVDGDQEHEVELEREHGRVRRREQRPGQRRGRRPEGEAHQLQPVHGHAHHLGGECVLALRAPRASGPRVVDEAEQDEHRCEEAERDEVVADGERAAVLDGQLLAEEVERVDAKDPVRSAGHVPGTEEELVPVRRECLEELEEEERDDRQVVAGQPARRQPEQQSRDTADHDDDRDRDHRPHVDSVVVGVEQRVRVGADPVEGDEA